MRISINLATRPFVELRPFFTKLRIVMGVLVLIAVGLGVALHTERVKLDEAQRQMNLVRDRTLRAQREKLGNEARMRQPANAAVLERARFLNKLFLAKSFSWTGVMMDLENVLPTGVQVTAIEPAITAEGDVVIRLRVAGDRDRAVLLVRNLERSSRFLNPRLAAEASQTKEQGGNNNNPGAQGLPPGAVQFDIFANYNPLPPAVEKTSAAPEENPAVLSAPKPKRTRIVPGPNDGIVLKPFRAPASPQHPGGTR